MDYVIHAHRDPVSLMAATLIISVNNNYHFSLDNIHDYVSDVYFKPDTITFLIGFSVRPDLLKNPNEEAVVWITPFTNGNEATNILSGKDPVYNDCLSITEDMLGVTLLTPTGESVSKILKQVNTLEANLDKDTLGLTSKLKEFKVPAKIKQVADNFAKIITWGSLPVEPKRELKKAQGYFLNDLSILIADNSISNNEAKVLASSSNYDGLLYCDFRLKGKSLITFTCKQEGDIPALIEYLKQHNVISIKNTGKSGYGLIPLNWLDILTEES